MNISRRKDKESNRPCVSEQATPDISNGHWGLERSRYCERPPISAIKMKLKRTQKNKVIRKKFYITKLEQPVIKAQFSLKLHNKYDILQDYDETDDEEVEKQWQDFMDAYKETAQEVLGYKKKGQKPWIC